jgi:FtsH-binding integral membrane protein
MHDLERDRVDEDRTIEETATVEETSTAQVDERSGVDAARERFGGRDLPASLAGMLVALASLLLLAGLASAAIGTIAFQTGVEGNESELSLGALITAGVVIFLAFLLGGWAAGRMARYNGALNGFMVAVWFVVLGVVLAIVGAIADNTYNLFEDLRVAEATLPNWFSVDDVTTGAIISSLAFVALMVLGAVLGGIWGTRMHTRADREIAAGYAGGVVERRVIERDVRQRSNLLECRAAPTSG